MKTLLLASALFAAAAVAVPPGPTAYSAFCKTLWLFAAPCSEISTTIVNQIRSFNPMIGCDACQYRLVSVTPVTIQANHSSPFGIEAESLSFTFSPIMTGGCRVSAKSISMGFTSLLDDGLNYCNLYNLVSASGLTTSKGFMEITTEWACLGYGIAICRD